MDAYPRPDTLADSGVDISPFLTALKRRGFTIYEDATSKQPSTFGTLTEMLGGAGPMDSVQAQRETRQSWRLPIGWAYIAPAAGLVVIPDTPRLNPGGFNGFEEKLLSRTLPARLFADVIFDGYRSELSRALDLLASTGRQKVFAHILAPHGPILYGADGTPVTAPACYPVCAPEGKIGFEAAGYIHWLNGEVLTVVDQILARRPHAEIVLFSDHGGRFDPNDEQEFYRTFFASRTPSRPDLFKEAAHPGDVMKRLASGS